MGDSSDLIMEGHLCIECGTFIDDKADGFDGACGYPRYCRACGGLPAMNGQKPMPSAARRRQHERARKKSSR